MAGSPTIQGVTTRERIINITRELILTRGFAGSSIDDIISQVGLTKGGFFYHFKNKAELGRAVVESYAAQNFALFSDFDRRADEACDDPFDSMIIFLKHFEMFIETRPNPPTGCLFACYLYGVDNFDDDVMAFVSQALGIWEEMYTRRCEDILRVYTPKHPVSAQDLGEMITAIIEGALILARHQGDYSAVVRGSTQFRQYLHLLFDRH